jgi:hypothetical protein
MEHEHVFRDIQAEFMENLDLGLSVDPGAYDRLYEFFDSALVPLLSTGRVSWEHHGRQRRFVLACAAGLGRRADEAARSAGHAHVGREELDAAARHLVDYWEAICVLPRARRAQEEDTRRHSCPVRQQLQGAQPAAAPRAVG